MHADQELMIIGFHFLEAEIPLQNSTWHMLVILDLQ